MILFDTKLSSSSMFFGLFIFLIGYISCWKSVCWRKKQVSAHFEDLWSNASCFLMSFFLEPRFRCQQIYPIMLPRIAYDEFFVFVLLTILAIVLHIRLYLSMQVKFDNLRRVALSCTSNFSSEPFPKLSVPRLKYWLEPSIFLFHQMSLFHYEWISIIFWGYIQNLTLICIQ